MRAPNARRVLSVFYKLCQRHVQMLTAVDETEVSPCEGYVLLHVVWDAAQAALHLADLPHD